MAHREIENILRKAIGLKIASVGDTVINRAVSHRMQFLKITEHDIYIKKLQTSPLELRELIEEVVVHETWFFRDSEPFNALVDFAFKLWNPAHSGEVLRILSAPCSTGEEPYSVAMALLQAGWPEQRFTVDAVDISMKAINKAKQAFFAEKSFRTANLSFRRIYFRKQEARYQLLPLVTRKVRFIHGNIADPTFLARLGAYDVIFCRNILIYLDGRHQKQIVESFHRILAEDGLLITGHSEAALFPHKKFRPYSQERTFAFFKTVPVQNPVFRPQQARALLPKDRNKLPAATDTASHPASLSRMPGASAKPSLSGSSPDELLLHAREQANLGKLSEAATLCEQYLEKYGPSAEGYFFLGLIREGQDESASAYDLFRKALYMAPDHVESLIHLSYLAEKVGNHRGAANYRRRAAKLMDKE